MCCVNSGVNTIGNIYRWKRKQKLSRKIKSKRKQKANNVDVYLNGTRKTISTRCRFECKDIRSR